MLLPMQAEELTFEPGTLTGELLILSTAANQLFQSTQYMSPDAQVCVEGWGVHWFSRLCCASAVCSRQCTTFASLPHASHATAHPTHCTLPGAQVHWHTTMMLSCIQVCDVELVAGECFDVSDACPCWPTRHPPPHAHIRSYVGNPHL
jgi:hypothetical protein